MRTLQEVMTNQQAKMSKVEEVTTTTAASAAANQRKTQDMVGRMMRMMKRKRNARSPTQMRNWRMAPHGKLAASGLHRCGAKTMQELVQATVACLVYRQAESVRAREQHSDAREITVECSGILVPPLYI